MSDACRYPLSGEWEGGRDRPKPPTFTAMMDSPFSLTLYSLKEDLVPLERESREAP